MAYEFFKSCGKNKYACYSDTANTTVRFKDRGFTRASSEPVLYMFLHDSLNPPFSGFFCIGLSKEAMAYKDTTAYGDLSYYSSFVYAGLTFYVYVMTYRYYVTDIGSDKVIITINGVVKNIPYSGALSPSSCDDIVNALQEQQSNSIILCSRAYSVGANSSIANSATVTAQHNGNIIVGACTVGSHASSAPTVYKNGVQINPALVQGSGGFGSATAYFVFNCNAGDSITVNIFGSAGSDSGATGSIYIVECS